MQYLNYNFLYYRASITAIFRGYFNLYINFIYIYD
jgi:hypothetical protein